ncbi:MAG: hypothetical protein ACP6IY_19510 [Promethearchaeia archaeon]
MTKKIKKIVIELPEEFYNKLKIASKTNSKSINKIIHILLKKYLKKSPPQENQILTNEELIEKQIEKDINKIIDIFYQSDETTKNGLLFRNKNQRNAVKKLIEKFGFEQIELITKVAMEARKEPYAPVITNPIELEAKLIKLKLFIERKKNEGGQIIKGTDFSKTVKYSEQDLKNFEEINKII